MFLYLKGRILLEKIYYDCKILLPLVDNKIQK